MKTNIRSSALRHALSGIALLFASALVGNSAELPSATPPAPPARPVRSPAERKAAREALMTELLERDANAKVVLRAIGTPGGVPVAMFDVNDEPKLVIEHSELVGWVAEIDVAKAQVTVKSRNGSLRVFTLTEPRAVKFPEFSPGQVESFLRPTRRPPPFDGSVPNELLQAWGDLNREAKEVILLSYLRSGVVLDISSSSSLSRAPLFSRQIEQRQQERLQAFLATLTPEQHALFKGSSQGLVRIGASPEEQEAQAAKNRLTKSKQEELVASLTPEQRKLYDAMRSGP